MVLVFTTSLHAQGNGRNTTWIVTITFSDPMNPSVVDTFGTGIGYTRCIDPDPRLPFAELEERPPWALADARFIDTVVGNLNCLRAGVWTNIHGGSYSHAITDTFLYSIYVTTRDKPWYVTWDTTNIHKKLNSLVIQDAHTGTLVNADMLATDSLMFTIDSPTKNVSLLYIYATWKPIDSSFVMGTEKQQDRKMLPAKFALHQNYPNPFNPSTAIEYDLPSREYVSLKVYNLLGQEVATLTEGLQEAGYKSVKFESGSLSSGVYMYRLVAEKYSDMKKMVLLR
jgi:hypothetical protein